MRLRDVTARGCCDQREEAADEIEKLQAERDAAMALLREVNEKHLYQRPAATHWEGCEEFHPECEIVRRIEAFINAARGNDVPVG